MKFSEKDVREYIEENCEIRVDATFTSPIWFENKEIERASPCEEEDRGDLDLDWDGMTYECDDLDESPFYNEEDLNDAVREHLSK